MGGGIIMNNIEISKELIDFIQNSPSMFHSVKTVRDYLEEAGFTYLPEGEPWRLEKGSSLSN